jgi:hypothetical protein
MNLQRIEQGLSSIVAEASFILRIENPTDHEKALDLMNQLIEDYAKHEPLIDLLCISIEKYENSAHDFLYSTKACHKSIQVYIPKPPQNSRFRTTGALQFEARQ